MTISRRHFLTMLGGGAGAAVAVGTTLAISAEPSDASSDSVVPFYGEHQAGIITPAQDRLHFAAFDITTSSRDELVTLLKAWTVAAAEMTQGRDVGQFGAMDGPHLAPPEDTGEAHDLQPAKLTITFGFGPGVFEDANGIDRFGVRNRRPAAFRPLPHFPADNLDPNRSGGDLCVQACSDDPQVAVHAIRNLARIGFGTVKMRWSQLGFGRTSSTSKSQTTARNLFGFKDGTNNITAEKPDDLKQSVWVDPADENADWLAGGSYMVVRRVKMQIEIWDRTSLAEQETIIGRSKKDGAPLSGGKEFTPPDFTMIGANDEPIIPIGAHIRNAHPSLNGGAQMLRRGYNFTDGTNELGNLDAGLFFIAYIRDVHKEYVPVQLNLATNDILNEYTQHTASALFVVPQGVKTSSDFIGSSLFV
jgi:deferrochelatase/peroxidase EfeB